jgi:hypothetical protein
MLVLQVDERFRRVKQVILMISGRIGRKRWFKVKTREKKPSLESFTAVINLTGVKHLAL